MDNHLLVIGGGPAGLATAIRARQAGLTVTVLDRRRPTIDSACGEGIMPDGLAELSELGVEPAADGCSVFRGIRYLDGDTVAEGGFPGQPGRGIRRTFLHAALVDRADNLGADLRWGRKVTGLEDCGVSTNDGPVTGRWLVAADGRNSRIRHLAGLDGSTSRHRRFAVRRHFTIEPWTDFVEVHWVDGAEAYVTPVGPCRVGVALLWSDGKASFDNLLARFPVLARRLDGAPVESRDRGAGPLERAARAVVRGNLALVGDASGYLDPITGEGLSLAFHHASAVVDAILAGDLEQYTAAHRRINRVPMAMTRLVLTMERNPWLRRRVVRALAGDPDLFSRFLAIHARQLPARGLGVDGLIRLARGVAKS